MITLAMDTAYKYLTIGLYQDGKLLKGVALPAFKKQSELLFTYLNQLLKDCDLKYKNIDEIVITDGPGSYTGVRIAMAAAKVLASQLQIPLYTLSTMQLYAGSKGSFNVILDARSSRAYCGYVENGKLAEKESILTLDEIPAWLDANPGTLIGDTYLLNQESEDPNFLENFIALKENYHPVQNIHALTPRYLKESDAYKA